MSRANKRGTKSRQGVIGRLKGYFRQRQLEKLEERDWRRRIILATRKIQEVNISLTGEVADVRGLSSNLEATRPEMQSLEESLETSRSTFVDLERSIREHAESLRDKLDAQAGTLEVQGQAQVRGTDDGRVLELKQMLQEKEASITDLETKVAGLSAELQETYNAPAALEARRVAELELQLRGLESVRGELGQAHAELEGLRLESDERSARMEARLRSNENERAELLGRHEQELAELQHLAQARVTELEGELRSERKRRDEREAEIVASRQRAEEQVLELEAQARAMLLRETEEEKRRHELDQATALFEERIEELQTLLEEIEGARQSQQQVHGRELAESAARIMELEAHNTELEEARKGGEGRMEELANLEVRLADSEQSRAESEEKMERLLAAAGRLEDARLTLVRDHENELAGNADRIRQLESSVDDLRAAREFTQTRLEEARVEARGLEEELSKLQDQMRSSEMARVQLETRHRTEMTQFADHSAARIRQVTGSLREKESEVERLNLRITSLTQVNETMQSKADELTVLQDELRASSEEIGARTSRLLDLMRPGGDGEHPSIPEHEDASS